MIDTARSWHFEEDMRKLGTRTFIPSLAAVALIGAACVSDDGAGGDGDGPEEPQWPMVESELPRDEVPDATSEEIQTLTADQAALALDLYHAMRVDPELELEDEGFSISPYSVHLAFGMLYGGTVGQARQEMQATMHFSLPDDRQHVALNWQALELASRERPADEGSTPQDPVILRTSNGVWIDEPLADMVNPDYVDLLAVNYGTGLYLGDFGTDLSAENERLRINEWVSVRTKELIPELFKPGMLDGGTTAVLVNALYFKAPWKEPFEEFATAPADFNLLGGGTVSVDMMSMDELDCVYVDGADYDAVGVPLRGNALEMTFIVPDDFTAFEAGLDGPGLEAILDSMSTGIAAVEIPRFELSTDVSLYGTLREDLGMPAPFEDHSSFDDIVPGLGVITEVVHNTVIKVDEKGTEAAAATGIVVGDEVGGGGSSFSLTVDRPFFVVIDDRLSGTVLFFGRVLDPNQG